MSEWFDYGPGIKMKKLGAEDGRGFYLMRMGADAKIERGSHQEEETLVALEGAIDVSVWRSDPVEHTVTYRWRTVTILPFEEHEVRVRAPHDGALVLVVARPDFEVPNAQG